MSQAPTQIEMMTRVVEETSRPDPGMEEFVETHQSPLLRYAWRLVRNEESAQDVVQEAFLKLIKEREKNGRPRNVSTWLYRVTHNLCVDLIRKEQRMRAGTEQLEPPPPMENPAQAFAKEERREHFDRLLGRLTENQRTVLILKMQEGKTYRQISEITGLTISNVGFLIHRALKKLGEHVRREELI